MKLLKLGSTENDVKNWQYFLTGQELYTGPINGKFDEPTFESTKAFQRIHNLNPDGKVGNYTAGKAMLLGFGVVIDEGPDITSDAFPGKPGFSPLVTNEEREKIFGKIVFTPDPTPDNPEKIRITNNWANENIVKISIRQLIPVKGSETVYFHKLAANQLIKLFNEWEQNNLLHNILTWDGSFNARFVRGSRRTLSNHSFGSAFDINYAWNKLGAVPALVGQKGCVRELVELANENGFYWGGHFTRRDGMHFEIAKIL